MTKLMASIPESTSRRPCSSTFTDDFSTPNTTKMNSSSLSVTTVGIRLDNLTLSTSRGSGETSSSQTLTRTSTDNTPGTSIVTRSTPPSSIATSEPLDEKKAKRKARRELNRLRRRAEVEAKAEATKLQLWEEALDQVPLPTLPPKQTVTPTPPPSGMYDLNNPQAVAFVEHLLSQYGKWNITFLDPSYRIFITPIAAISVKLIRVSGLRVAVVFGNPLCAPTDLDDTISTFHSECKKHGWGLSFVGVRSDVVALTQKRGWATVQFSEEPMIDPATNPVLDGVSGRRTLLHVKKLAKSQTLSICPPGTASPALQDRLQALYDQCYASRTSPYSTKLHLFALKQVTYFYLGTAENPTAVAGLVHTGEGAILDPCVASPDAPPAATDFLTIMAMGYARRIGIRVSFGPEPLRLVEVQGMRGTMGKGTRLVGAAAYDAFSFEGKKTLHDKFHPASRQQQFLVLASKRTLGQASCAMAVWQATHLHGGEVVAPFLRIVKGKLKEGKLLSRGKRQTVPPLNTSEVTLVDV